MTLDQMMSLTEGFSTKADKMRILERHGYARADIARFLGVRYQQVRNTLEGDKRTGYSPELITPFPSEPSVPFNTARFVQLAIDDDGQAILPYELIEDFADAGQELFAVAVAGGVFVSDVNGMIARVEKSFE